MTESVFSKIYSYRERENNDSKENYLIEIFAHCLQTDKKLLNDFLDKLNLKADSDITIKTQSTYEFGRPDIEINIPTTKTCILIECKIEHFERPNQLDDYKKILENKNVSKRHLVYLTKYYAHREDNNKFIKLHLIKWADVFQIVNENNSQLSNEFKLFLKNENMSESKNLNYTDLSVLTNISGTISKMNEVIDGVSEYYQKKIGALSKQSSRSTKMEREDAYATYHYAEKRNKFCSSVDIGFFWWESEEVYIGTLIWFSLSEKYKETEKHFRLMKKYLKGWKVNKAESCYTIGRYKAVSQFINDEEEQIPAMVEFLRKCVDELTVVKKIDRSIFK